MAKKYADPFAPSISLWQHGVALVSVGGGALLWPSPWALLVVGLGLAFGASVEGIAIALSNHKERP